MKRLQARGTRRVDERDRKKETRDEVTREREKEDKEEHFVNCKTRRLVFLQFLSAKRLTANRIHALVREECFIFPLYAATYMYT